MRRPFKSSADYRVQKGHPELDFTQEQFAGIGKVAMAFNEVEDQLAVVFSEVVVVLLLGGGGWYVLLRRGPPCFGGDVSRGQTLWLSIRPDL